MSPRSFSTVLHSMIQRVNPMKSGCDVKYCGTAVEKSLKHKSRTFSVRETKRVWLRGRGRVYVCLAKCRVSIRKYKEWEVQVEEDQGERRPRQQGGWRKKGKEALVTETGIPKMLDVGEAQEGRRRQWTKKELWEMFIHILGIGRTLCCLWEEGWEGTFHIIILNNQLSQQHVSCMQPFYNG